MAVIRLFGPSLRAPSILPTEPAMLWGGKGTNRSLGMDNSDADPMAGSRCKIIVTSLRAPGTSAAEPNWAASLGSRPVRVLEPTSRMFIGGSPEPPSPGTTLARLGSLIVLSCETWYRTYPYTTAADTRHRATTRLVAISSRRGQRRAGTNALCRPRRLCAG